MANCNGMNCIHKDEQTGKCSFSGSCSLQQREYKDAKSVLLINDSISVAVAPVKAESVVDNAVVFNPFQRGNGCMLAGYTFEEIFAHTR